MDFESENRMILDKEINAYNIDVDKHGISSKSVKWDNPQTQYFRFEELIKYIDLNSSKKTLLDLGCGNAELYKYLNFRGFRGQYAGIDINEKLLEQAKVRFPNINVHKKDILSPPPPYIQI